MIARLLAVLSLLVLSLIGACQSDVSTELNGKPCDSKGECLPGFACVEVGDCPLRRQGHDFAVLC